MSQTQHKTLVKDLLPKKQLRNQKKISNEEITERNEPTTTEDMKERIMRVCASIPSEMNHRALDSYSLRLSIDYPLDIWFIISEYIKPETVGKFACICKSSYYVTTTAKFWFHLYKTYYKFVPGIPERLQPHWMILRHELRLCVIRTLHYTYFAERRALSYISRIQQKEPHSLVKRQCSLMWHEKGTNRWYFFFKLKEISGTCNGTLIQQNKSMDDDIETAEKINANSEEKCKLLQVRCLKYSKLPLVIGLILQKVSVTLMPGLKYLRLQLGFGTSDLPNALTNQVILNDVIDYEVFDWWHPRYPHQDTISYLCDVDSTIQLTSDDTWD